MSSPAEEKKAEHPRARKANHDKSHHKAELMLANIADFYTRAAEEIAMLEGDDDLELVPHAQLTKDVKRDHPKKLSEYQQYLKDNYDHLKKANPGLNSVELLRVAARGWNAKKEAKLHELEKILEASVHAGDSETVKSDDFQLVDGSDKEKMITIVPDDDRHEEESFEGAEEVERDSDTTFPAGLLEPEDEDDSAKRKKKGSDSKKKKKRKSADNPDAKSKPVVELHDIEREGPSAESLDIKLLLDEPVGIPEKKEAAKKPKKGKK